MSRLQWDRGTHRVAGLGIGRNPQDVTNNQRFHFVAPDFQMVGADGAKFRGYEVQYFQYHASAGNANTYFALHHGGASGMLMDSVTESVRALAATGSVSRYRKHVNFGL